MQQIRIQVPIGSMPINLLLLGSGEVAFARVANFKALFDMCPVVGGVDAAFYEDAFTIGSETYHYNTAYPYKDIPGMLSWIVAQKLIEPIAHYL